MTHQPELIPDQPSPDQATRETERAEYLERLREKLKALDFCAVEGFFVDDETTSVTAIPSLSTLLPMKHKKTWVRVWEIKR